VVGIEKDGLVKVFSHVTTAFKTTGRKEFSSEYGRESSAVLIRVSLRARTLLAGKNQRGHEGAIASRERGGK
jgi:hypothetical protein